MNNEHELTLYDQTIIQEATDNAVINMAYHTVPISDISSLNNGDVCDFMGVLIGIGDINEFTSKSGKELTKRTLTFGDKTQSSIDYTLWGEEAKTFEGETGDVFAFKGAKVSEYNGKSLSGGMSSRNPDLSEAHSLSAWYNEHGNIEFNKLSTNAFTQPSESQQKGYVTIKEAKDKINTLVGDSTYRSTHLAMISSIPVEGKPLFYASCPKCKKKVE